MKKKVETNKSDETEARRNEQREMKIAINMWTQSTEQHVKI